MNDHIKSAATRITFEAVKRWLMQDPKRLALAGFLYFVSPIDAIPDVIVGLGQIDDVIVVVWVIVSILKAITRKNEPTYVM